MNLYVTPCTMDLGTMNSLHNVTESITRHKSSLWKNQYPSRKYVTYILVAFFVQLFVYFRDLPVDLLCQNTLYMYMYLSRPMPFQSLKLQ